METIVLAMSSDSAAWLLARLWESIGSMVVAVNDSERESRRDALESQQFRHCIDGLGELADRLQAIISRPDGHIETQIMAAEICEEVAEIALLGARHMEHGRIDARLVDQGRAIHSRAVELRDHVVASLPIERFPQRDRICLPARERAWSVDTIRAVQDAVSRFDSRLCVEHSFAEYAED